MSAIMVSETHADNKSLLDFQSVNSELDRVADTYNDADLPELLIDTSSWDDDREFAVQHIDDPHDVIEQFIAQLGTDADDVQEQIEALLQQASGGKLMPVITDTCFRVWHHPAIDRIATSTSIRALGLWVWNLAADRHDCKGMSILTADDVATTIEAKWNESRRKYDETMEFALRQTLAWAAGEEDLPDDLAQVLRYVYASKRAAARRVTPLTVAEALMTILSYALRNHDDVFFASARDLERRLRVHSLPGTSRSTLKDAIRRLKACGVWKVIRQADHENRLATEYRFTILESEKLAGNPPSRLTPALATVALRRLNAASKARLQENGVTFPSGNDISGDGVAAHYNVGISGGGITVERHWQKKDILAASAGREIEVLQNVCGIAIDESRLDGQPCPQCPGSRDSFSLRPDRRDGSRNVVHCRKCGWRGADVIQVTRDRCNLNMADACAVLGRYLGVSPRAATGSSRRAHAESRLPGVRADVANCHGLNVESLQCLETAPTIREHRLGNGHLLFTPVLRIQTYQSKGRILEPAGRVDVGTDCKFLKKGMCLKNETPGIHAPRNQRINPGNKVVIVEGWKDGLRLQELHPRVKWIGLTGTQLPHCDNDWQEYLRDCHIVRIPDRDLPGIAGAERDFQHLRRVVATFHTAHISDDVREKDGDGIREVAMTPEGRARISSAINNNSLPMRHLPRQRSLTGTLTCHYHVDQSVDFRPAFGQQRQGPTR